MGRVALERKTHLPYAPELVAHWKEQSQEFKDLCDETGRPYGYSGMNIFYFFLYQYWAHEESGVERQEFKHTL